MNKLNRSFQKAIVASYSILGSLFFFGFIGYFLKNKFDNKWWLISGLILGCFFGLYDLYKQINKK
jgi:F0F1-type ATP synthase assembly protein I|tara:strand:+ start:1106 stop:1300 length:195 start_codon:yes stop_codon:yes gene_type:complete